ncbi:hypothetical protein COV18_01200 [Candidatus Woesearchaeota archaeon CG10_big_fil_rev_8_21_14_0_10_37_12]|nr:MAG: hypothetical protein COV18_01200 [Candidatus Woesearchaeota archaeon CG10_big_fil_rev_8_21_14_0_10_37_12]
MTGKNIDKLDDLKQEEDEQQEEYKASKQTIIFSVVAGVVLLVVIGFLFFGFDDSAPTLPTVEYNYFKFEQIGGMWQTTIELDDQPYEAPFRFNPEQVQDVPVVGKFSGFVKMPVYITFDPESEYDDFKYLALGVSELTLHMVRALNVSVEAACTKNVTDACVDRPIVTCGDFGKSVIYLHTSNETLVNLSNHCITLSGPELDLLKPVDRLLFQWYKIMS